MLQPGAAQQMLLRAYLERNTSTAFGKAHGFETIRNYEEFARNVPLADYDAFQPWIDRVRKGEPNVLTHEAVTHLVPTSGTTSARKLIPFTAGLQREFNAAIGPWLIDLYRQIPGSVGGPAYWSITPVIGSAEMEAAVGNNERPAALPIGFDSDTAYLGGARKRLVEATMAVPPAIQRAASIHTFRYATLLSLLRCRELRLISVWHPSFLSLLLDALPAHWEKLLVDVENGSWSCGQETPSEGPSPQPVRPLPQRAKELRAADPLTPATLWPKLRLVSCWGDGPAALALADLKQRFPNVRLQPKGVIATEAFVTLPFGSRHPLAITSHFFEFIADSGRVHLAGDLRQGSEYEVVVTTAGGLWRYRLGDRVRVNGFVRQTPSFAFLARNGNVSDQFGEKLSEAFVAKAMCETFGMNATPPAFALLAPDRDEAGCHYTLYVEGTPRPAWTKALDAALRQNPHYAYCRDLGQLLPIRLFVIPEGAYQKFAERETANGARLGDVKPTLLSQRNDWSKVFVGTYADH
jgi:hypothetical protein